MSNSNTTDLSKIVSKKYFVPIVLIALILLGFLVYSNSLHGAFIWDDTGLVKNNVYIRSFSNLRYIFTQNIGQGAQKRYTFYRPIQLLTYMIDCNFWKLNVVGYHLTNIILHILVAVSIFFLVNNLFKNKVISLFTSLLFIVHPIHTEAVAYISGRAESLYALFVLVSFIFYVKLHENYNIKYYFIILFSFILSLLSKENALIFPAILCVYHFIFRKKIIKKIFLPVIFIDLIYILTRVTWLDFSIPGRLKDVTLLQRLPGFFDAISVYMRLLLLPFNLHMEYGIRILPFAHLTVIVGALATLTLLAGAFILRKKNRLVSFSILFFFVALFPVSNIYPVNASLAEHWLYLPSVGFFIIAGWLIWLLYKNKNLRLIAIILLTGLIAFYFYLTVKQNEYWQDSVRFYKRTLKYAPDSFRVRANLGRIYSQRGEYEKAIEFNKKSIEINPNNPLAYNNLGNIYLAKGQHDKAIESFKKAIQQESNYAFAYNNLAATYIIKGEYKKAIALCKKAIEISPRYARPYFNLALIYYAQEKSRLADSYLRKAESLGYKPNLEIIKKFKSKTENKIKLYENKTE
jgi:tetratricopeptide (TPR) repeat protein